MRNHVQFIGRGYSGHWEVITAGDDEENARN
jgi:hypothetical protein